MFYEVDNINSEYSSMDGPNSSFLVKNILNISEVSAQNDFAKTVCPVNPSETYGYYNASTPHESVQFSSTHNYYFPPPPTHSTHCSLRAMSSQFFNTDYDHSAYSIPTSDSFVYLTSVNNNNNYHKTNDLYYGEETPFAHEYVNQATTQIKAEYDSNQLNNRFESNSPVDSSSQSQCEFTSVTRLVETSTSSIDPSLIATKQNVSPTMNTTSKYVQGLESICNSSLTSVDDKNTSKIFFR